MADLSQDREKALEQIAAGWGRTATRAHPLCTCGKPTEPWPAVVPPCTRCGAEAGEICRDPGAGRCGASSAARYRRRVRESQSHASCPVHGGTR